MFKRKFTSLKLSFLSGLMTISPSITLAQLIEVNVDAELDIQLFNIGTELDINADLKLGALNNATTSVEACGDFDITYNDFGVGLAAPDSALLQNVVPYTGWIGGLIPGHGVNDDLTLISAVVEPTVALNRSGLLGTASANSPIEWQNYYVIHLKYEATSGEQCFYPGDSFSVGDLDGTKPLSITINSPLPFVDPITVSLTGEREIAAVFGINRNGATDTEKLVLPAYTNVGSNIEAENNTLVSNLLTSVLPDLPIIGSLFSPGYELRVNSLLSIGDTAGGPPLYNIITETLTNPNDVSPYDPAGYFTADFGDQCITDLFYLYGNKDDSALGEMTLPSALTLLTNEREDEFLPDRFTVIRNTPLPCVMDLGDAPESYHTTIGSNGPVHYLQDYTSHPDKIIRLGNSVTAESTAIPSANADSDSGDDGITTAFPLADASPGDTYQASNIRVINKLKSPSQLCGWIDFDMNEQGHELTNPAHFEGDGHFEHADEMACVTVPDPSAENAFGAETLAAENGNCVVIDAANGVVNCNLTWTIPDDFTYVATEPTFARIRVGNQMVDETVVDMVSNQGEVEDYMISAGTLPVELSAFRTTKTLSGINFQWSTDTELANLGYNFWIKLKGRWNRVNENLYPGAINSMERNEYRKSFLLNRSERQSKIEAVAISSVSTSGREEMYGPYELGKRYGFAGEAPEPFDWSAVVSKMDNSLEAHGYIKVGQNWFHKNSRTGKRLNRRSTSHGYLGQISVNSNNAGMVKVSHEALLNAGVDLTNQEVTAIALTYAGNPVTIDVENEYQNRWTAQSALVFHTAGLESVSLDVAEMVYQLSLDYGNHLLSPDINTQVSADALTSVVSKVSKHESQVEYNANVSGDDPWIAKGMYNYRGKTNGDHRFSHELTDVGDGSGVMTVSFISTYDDRATVDDGMIKLYQETSNGLVELGSALYQGKDNHQLDISIEAGVLQEGVNKFRIKLIPVEGGGQYSYILMDKTQLTFAATIDNQSSVSDAFVQKADSDITGNYDATNVDAASKVYAVLDHDQSMMEIAVNEGQLQKLSSEFGDIRYYIVKDGGYINAQVTALSLPDASSISSDNADYLIITHPLFNESFASAAGSTFINHKQNAGHNVKVVNYSDVIQLTGYGISSEATLSAYIRDEKAANANLKYVMLVGSACRDTRDFTGNGCVNMIPTRYVTSSGSKQTPSDFRLGDVDDDGYADVVVGRLPARTQDELDNILAKINANAVAKSNNAPLKAILSADKFDTAYYLDFDVQQQRIAEYFPENTETVNVFADDGANRQSMMDALNDGADIWSYSGHSSMYSLGGGVRLLNAADGSTLTNSRYAFAMPLACYMTYSVHESVNTISYQLMNNANGVSGVFGSAVLTSYSDNEVLQREIIKLMSPDNNPVDALTLGEAILQAQYKLPSSSTTLSGANLMGDPSTQFK